MPSVASIASHAKRILIKFVQPQGNQLNFVFTLALAAGARVRVRLVQAPHDPSLSRCPQLSTHMRDHRGRV